MNEYANNGDRSKPPCFHDFETEDFDADSVGDEVEDVGQAYGPAPVDGPTLLLLDAAGAGNAGRVAAALNLGAAIDAQDDQGKTALISAVESGHTAVASLLLDRSASVHPKDFTGRDALTVALTHSPPMVHLLAAHGSDVDEPDAEGCTRLIGASALGRWERIGPLLNAGADINFKSCLHDTPLTAAVGSGSESTICLLLDRGADIHGQSYSGNTPLIQAASTGEDCMLDLLVGYGADVNSANKSGVTALMAAVFNGHLPTTEFLLEHGASPEAADADGHTAADIAMRESQSADPEMAATYKDIAALLKGRVEDKTEYD